jgi:histidinol-phosphate aminotransferase
MSMGALRLRQAIRGIPPYVPGKSAAEVTRELGITRVIKLASNESVAGPSPKALEAIRRSLSGIHRYPEDTSYELRMALARKLGVQPGNLLLGTGADEVLLLLGQLFLDPGDECLYPYPSFSLYRKSAQVMAAVPVQAPLREDRIDLEALLERVTPRTKLVFLCNPNNPTGHLVPSEEVVSFLDRLPEHVFPVIDEAYAEFVDDPGFRDAVSLFRQGRQLAAIRTFSKIYGIAGLRVGYAVVPPEIPTTADGIRNSFNVNVLAQAAALAALEDEEHVERTRRLTFAGRAQLARGLRAMGLQPIPSQTNFVCVGIGRDAQPLFQRLLRRGLIIRPLAGFAMPQHIRITVGTEGENAEVLAALKEELARG